MNTEFMDECLRARLEYLQDRFQIEDFRRMFRQEYARRGMVMIQDKASTVKLAGGMTLDAEYGFIFSSKRYLDFAMCMLRHCGFNVIHRREHDRRGEYSAYVVQLGDEFISRRLGSERAGRIRTGLRSISNIDREKKEAAIQEEIKHNF